MLSQNSHLLLAPTTLHPDTPPIISRVRAVYDFPPRSEDELSFKKGDVIGITSTFSDGWSKGVVMKGVGDGVGRAFPMNFVEEIEE